MTGKTILALLCIIGCAATFQLKSHLPLPQQLHLPKISHHSHKHNKTASHSPAHVNETSPAINQTKAANLTEKDSKLNSTGTPNQPGSLVNNGTLAANSFSSNNGNTTTTTTAPLRVKRCGDGGGQLKRERRAFSGPRPANAPKRPGGSKGNSNN